MVAPGRGVNGRTGRGLGATDGSSKLDFYAPRADRGGIGLDFEGNGLQANGHFRIHDLLFFMV